MLSLDSPVAKFAPWLIVATLVVTSAVGISQSSSGQSEAGDFGGDFPSFYGAGSIVLDGHGEDLYDVELQQQVQSDQFEDGGYLYFAYPPYTALPYAGLAALPYNAAFVLHTILAVAALIGAVLAFRPFARGMLDGRTRLGIGVAASLAMYPVLRSVLGGQNATFTLLLLVLVARFDHEDHAMATGLAAAAMLFKPQFGVLVILVLVVARRWRATAWAIGGAAALFGAGVVVAGSNWLKTWLEAVTAFGDENLQVNGELMVSMVGWIQNQFGTDPWTYVLAGGLLMALGIPIAIGLVTKRWTEIPWYAVAPLVVLAAPSALYYDTAMLLVTIAVAAAWFAGIRTGIAAAAVVVSWTQIAAGSLGWSPLFIPLVVIAAMLAAGAGRPRANRLLAETQTSVDP